MIKIKCNYCSALFINNTPCHEPRCPGCFTFTIGGKPCGLYRVWSLDVWGNRRDGFEVNDRSELGQIYIGDEASDETIIRKLKSRGWLNKRSQFRSFDVTITDFTIDIDQRRDSFPLFTLERT